MRGFFRYRNLVKDMCVVSLLGLCSVAMCFIAAGCMTAAGGHMVDTSAQTELLATTSVGTTPVHLGTHASCAPNINTSFMCEHRKQLLETLETVSRSTASHIILSKAQPFMHAVS